jgi:Tfp pilus assembly PilM family ATPase
MAWFARTTRSPIGIDAGSKYLRAVQARRDGVAWHIEAAASIPRQHPGAPVTEHEVSRFAALLDRQGFCGRDVVLAVPDEMVLGGVLKLPPRSSGAPLEQISRMEISRMHKCEPGTFEMAGWDLPSVGRGTDTTQVMAAACTHRDADALLDLFEPAGLTVTALDTSAWALARACAPLLGADITGILDIGWSATCLVMLYDGVVIYERTIPDAGVKVLYDQLTRRTGLDPQVIDLLLLDTTAAPPEERRQTDVDFAAQLRSLTAAHGETMAQEIEQSFSYAAHKYHDATGRGLLLTGGGACIAGICKAIGGISSIDPQPAAVTSLAQCTGPLVQSCDNPALTKALGLALHGESSRCDDKH